MANKKEQRPNLNTLVDAPKQKEAEMAKQRADERRKANHTIDPFRYGY